MLVDDAERISLFCDKKCAERAAQKVKRVTCRAVQRLVIFLLVVFCKRALCKFKRCVFVLAVRRVVYVFLAVVLLITLLVGKLALV